MRTPCFIKSSRAGQALGGPCIVQTPEDLNCNVRYKWPRAMRKQTNLMQESVNLPRGLQAGSRYDELDKQIGFNVMFERDHIECVFPLMLQVWLAWT